MHIASTLRHLLLCAVLACAALPASALERALDIALKADVVVTDRHVTLADLVSIGMVDAKLEKAMQTLRIANAPRVGYVEQYSREELEQAMRNRLPQFAGSLAWSGARSVKVRSQGRLVDTDALVEAARQHLMKELSGRFERVEVTLASPMAKLEVPTGELAFVPRAIDAKHFYARMPVWVDVFVDGAVYRSVVVPLSIKASQKVYVARRDLAEGSMVNGSDFALQLEDVSDIADEPVGAIGDSVRVKRAMVGGQVATRRHLFQQGTVFRGDPVKLVLNEGGVSIETRAVVQQDGAIGQLIKVRPENGMDVVAARVMSQGIVQADGNH